MFTPGLCRTFSTPLCSHRSFALPPERRTADSMEATKCEPLNHYLQPPPQSPYCCQQPASMAEQPPPGGYPHLPPMSVAEGDQSYNPRSAPSQHIISRVGSISASSHPEVEHPDAPCLNASSYSDHPPYLSHTFADLVYPNVGYAPQNSTGSINHYGNSVGGGPHYHSAGPPPPAYNANAKFHANAPAYTQTYNGGNSPPGAPTPQRRQNRATQVIGVPRNEGECNSLIAPRPAALVDRGK